MRVVVAATLFHLLAADAVAQPVEPTPPAPAPEPADAVAPISDPAPAAEPVPPVEPPPVVVPVEPAAPLFVPAPGLLSRIALHGFVSQGAVLSTSNDYIGASSRGHLEMFEVGLNVSTEISDKLRAGVQLFARRLGTFVDTSPRIDWAYLDYRWKPWLGMRAGTIKLPLGLYNEYVDIDAARLPILLPQGMYPFRNRDAFLSHTGFSAYGSHPLGGAGELTYQAWLGTLTVPENALELSGATLDGVDTKYVTGAQLFWQPPVDGLRIGGTVLRASLDFDLTLAPETVTLLKMAGLVPPEFDGGVVVSQRPTSLVIASAEYIQGDWLFAAEYSRAFTHQKTSLPMLIPTFDTDTESFYGMATYRLRPPLELGAYYSVLHLDAADRRGRDPKYAERFHAFQRDLAVTLRWDVNEYWLWKLESHLIDGTASLPVGVNADPKRYWGLFLLRTTVTF